MRTLLASLVALALFATALFAPMALGQSLPQTPQPATVNSPDEAAWQRIASLTSDSHVTVTAHGDTVHCQDLRVTDSNLSCEFQSWLFPTRSYRSDRDAIERIRLRHDKRNFWIGVGAASVAGLIYGGSRDTAEPRGVAAVEMGTLFGLASALFIYPAVRLIPGQTIYRRHP